MDRRSHRTGSWTGAGRPSWRGRPSARSPSRATDGDGHDLAREGSTMTKVQFEVVDGVAVVTLNRPESLNALDAETHALLAETWVEIKSRREIRVLVFTGNGRGFCAGTDLKCVAAPGELRD